MIRIIVADDHSVVRAGLKRVLAVAPDMDVVAEAGTTDQVVHTISTRACDALLLDIGMPGGNGLDLLQTIKTLRPRLAVIMLTMYADTRYVAKSLKAGAAGYVLKTDAAEEIVLAIRRGLAGRKYVSRVFEDLEEGALDQEEKSLSPREQEVLKLIAEGRRNSEIANVLALSHKTISTYRARILEKLKLSSNGELIHHVIKGTC